MRKRVLITGGAKGLGKSIAIEFARHGYDVTITYLKSEKEATNLKDYLKGQYGGNHSILKLDLTDEETYKDLSHKLTRLDVLVNNAAFNEDKNYDEFTKDDFLTTYEINVIGPYMLSVLLKELLAVSHGSIVNVSSTNGIDSMYKESIPYDASKAALINLTKNLSVALAPDIRVNAVAPGWIDTENTEDMEPSFKSFVEKANLFHRFATPEEIAKLIFFVASPDASYMTGEVVKIDGGVRYGNR